MDRFLVIAFLLVAASVQAQTIAADLQGKLAEEKNKVLQPEQDFTLGQMKYVAFYCGAAWCGPCHRFTPRLVNFYNEMRSEEHTSELQSHSFISYAVFCLT